MKKIATTFFIFSMVFCWVQISNAQCVQCDSTSVTPGEYASTIGLSDTATGYCSFAGGYNSNSEGQYSFAFGNDANALGNYSLAFGAISKSKYTGSITLGSYTISDGNKSIVLGHGQYTHPLVNNIDHSIMMGINSEKPTFFIQGAQGFGYTGRIGIGNVTSPQAKLHIREDENYDTASVYIQGFNENRTAYLWLGTKNYGLKKFDNNLEFLTNDNYVFNDGELGIGTDDPQAKVHVKEGDIFIEDIDHGIVMKSPDGNCWRGTLNNQGLLQFTEVDCDDLMVSTPEPEPAQNAGIRIYPNPTGNHVTVEIPAAHSGAELSIKSAAGSELATKTLRNTSTQINMSSYPAGVYFFYISVDEKLVEVKKVVKE